MCLFVFLQIGIQNLQWKFYIIWTLLNASFVPLMYFFYPETSDRSLEDIDGNFKSPFGNSGPS